MWAYRWSTLGPMGRDPVAVMIFCSFGISGKQSFDCSPKFMILDVIIC